MFIWIQLKKLFKALFQIPYCYLSVFLFRSLLPASSVQWREGQIKSNSEITACCSPRLNHSSSLTIILQPASCRGRPLNLSPLGNNLSMWTGRPLADTLRSWKLWLINQMLILDPADGKCEVPCWWGQARTEFWVGCYSLAAGQIPWLMNVAGMGHSFS